jgi:hypothetical protein
MLRIRGRVSLEFVLAEVLKVLAEGDNQAAVLQKLVAVTHLLVPELWQMPGHCQNVVWGLWQGLW